MTMVMVKHLRSAITNATSLESATSPNGTGRKSLLHTPRPTGVWDPIVKVGGPAVVLSTFIFRRGQSSAPNGGWPTPKRTTENVIV